MAFITESELREQWRTSGATRIEFPAGTKFSPAALDFINQWKLEVYVGGELIVSAAPRVSHYSEGGLPYLANKWTNVQER
jgi:ethanolamine utilization cobalamin adenosyltransferase